MEDLSQVQTEDLAHELMTRIEHGFIVSITPDDNGDSKLVFLHKGSPFVLATFADVIASQFHADAHETMFPGQDDK